MLLMLTPLGASRLLQALPRPDEPAASGPARPRLELGHWDVSLKELLISDSGDGVGASYVIPPIGNYATHASGIEKSMAGENTRPSCWQERWCCPGTRKEQDPQRRDKWLAGPTRKGQPQWLTKFDPSDESLVWKSYWAGPGNPPRQHPPADPDEPAASGRRAQRATAASSSDAWGASSSHTAGPKRATRRDSQGRPQAGPQAAAGSSADAATGAENAPQLTKRQKREQRRNVLYRSFRNWVDTAAEAARARGSRSPPFPTGSLPDRPGSDRAGCCLAGCCLGRARQQRRTDSTRSGRWGGGASKIQSSNIIWGAPV